MPKVSVVMPVYNGERFVAEAVESILEQTFTDFEFIVIDDGSTDRTPEILNEYQKRDGRICLYRMERNKGIVSALNQGLSMAHGEYIARMDTDDISLPQRLACQVAFLDQYTGIDILGTNICGINEFGKAIGNTTYPSTPAGVYWLSLLFSPFAHPSVMMRASAVKPDDSPVYRQEMAHIEDYDLWSRVLTLTNGANLPQFLLKYRITAGSITSHYADTEEEKHVSISQKKLEQEFPGEQFNARKLIHGVSGVTHWKEYNDRAEISFQFQKMWLLFREKYSAQVDLSKVQNEVMRIIMSMAIRPFGQKENFSALVQLGNLQKSWRILLVKFVFVKIFTKLGHLLHIPFIETRPVI